MKKVQAKFLLETGIRYTYKKFVVPPISIEDEVKESLDILNHSNTYIGTFIKTKSPREYKFKRSDSHNKNYATFTVIISDYLDKPQLNVEYEILVETNFHVVLAYDRI